MLHSNHQSAAADDGVVHKTEHSDCASQECPCTTAVLYIGCRNDCIILCQHEFAVPSCSNNGSSSTSTTSSGSSWTQHGIENTCIFALWVLSALRVCSLTIIDTCYTVLTQLWICALMLSIHHVFYIRDTSTVAVSVLYTCIYLLRHGSCYDTADVGVQCS